MRIYRYAVNKMRRAIAVAESVFIRTQRARWQRVATGGRPSWDDRNERLAALIAPGSTVVDLGCGAQTLRAYLPQGCTYQPCDLVASSPDVIVCDFNDNHYPDLPRKYDVVVCSGVLEYIRSPRIFLGNVREFGSQVFLTYNVRGDGDSLITRMTNHWVNHFSHSEIERLLDASGLDSEVMWIDANGETAFRLTPRPRSSSDGDAQ